MAFIDSILDTIPIFMAPTSISLKITSICFSIISEVTHPLFQKLLEYSELLWQLLYSFRKLH